MLGANDYSVNGSSINVTFPVTATSANLPFYGMPLQSVVHPGSDRDFRALRELTPLEWLNRQIDEVCLLGRSA